MHSPCGPRTRRTCAAISLVRNFDMPRRSPHSSNATAASWRARTARWQARRLRRQIHLRRRAAPAIPGRAAGRKLQALSIAWDTRTPKWAARMVSPLPRSEDRLPRRAALDTTCAELELHVRRLPFDRRAQELRRRADTYNTTWSEIAVGCEACHGPGSAHIDWAQSKGNDPAKGLTVALDERRGAHWTIDPASGNASRIRERRSDAEIEVCAPCHARRAQIAEGWRAGNRFLDHYSPALLEPPLYYADGQQRDEVYIWGSFLQSKMFRHGVTCADCHEPHTGKLRMEGNALCGQCHLATKYDTVAHHHHPSGSTGAQCVSCHMPTTDYMVIDARRDHSLRIPRPDLSVAIGTPNACSGCHRDKSAQWAADTTRLGSALPVACNATRRRLPRQSAMMRARHRSRFACGG